MSFSFEHPNAGGVLLPGQTCCHTGKLIPRKVRGDPLADPLLPECCPKLCSPIGVFPKDHTESKKKKKGEDEDDVSDTEAEDKENGTPNARNGNDSDDDDPSAKSGALPLESSPARLAGCAPCSASLKWSCCNACCGPCTLWSAGGFLQREGATPNPTAREYATWDGCTSIPDDAAVPDLGARDDLGERLAKVEIGAGIVSCIAVSPDGTLLVVGDKLGAATLFKLDPTIDDLGLEKIGTALPGARQTRKVKAKSFLDSDDEDDVVAPPENDDSDDDTPTAPTSKEGGHLGEVTCVVYAPDCQSVYTGSCDGTVKKWSVPELELQSTFDASEKAQLPASKKSSPEGSPGGSDDGEEDTASTKQSDDVLAVVLSGDGERLYAAGARTCVFSWDARTGERLGVLFQGRLIRAAIPGANVAEDDDEAQKPVAAAGETSRAARLEEEQRLQEEAAAAEALVTSLRAKGVPANVVRCLAIAPDAPDGELLVTGSRDGATRRWHMDQRTCEREFIAHKSPVAALAVSSDGGELVTGGAFGDGELRHYRWTPVAGVDQQYVEGEAKLGGGAYIRVRTLRAPDHPEKPAHPAGTISVVLSADERFAYSVGASPDEPVVQWNLEDGSSKLRIHAPHKGGTTAVCMLPDGVGGKAVPAVRQNGNPALVAVERAAAAAKGGRLLTAGVDGMLCVWCVTEIDPVAGATLAARNAQRRNATTATEFQKKEERAARATPELNRTDMAIKARKELPALERKKFPVNPATDEPMDLEDLSVEELEIMTSAELITCCLAHGLLVINPKAPPSTKREIASKMFDFFEKEKAKAKARMRAERLARR